MSELRHAREAKRLLASRYRADERVAGFGIGVDATVGYVVEGRLREPFSAPLPSAVMVVVDQMPAEVSVRWSLAGTAESQS